MKKIFLFLAIIPLFAIADLTIEQLGPNVVVVSGEGNGEYPAVVITNLIGYCTNCIAASPEQIINIKGTVNDLVANIRDDTRFITNQCNVLQFQVDENLNDIAHFYKVNSAIDSSTVKASMLVITNLIYHNQLVSTQKTLTQSFLESYDIKNANTSRAVIGYFNGIYDYGQSQVSSYNNLSYELSRIKSSATRANEDVGNISHLVNEIPTELCTEITYLPGYIPGEGDSSTTNVPGIGLEQLDTILEYLRHIDDDQHTRSNQLSYISTNLVILSERTHATYELLRMSLFNDATIVTDDGANSWSNVYNSGKSQLYDYNRSNILQRIELLLYGVSGINSEVETDTESYEQSMQIIETSLQESQQQLTSSLQSHSQKLSTIGDSLKGFFQSASFLGQGSIAYSILPSVSITIGRDNFDVHTLGMDEAQHSTVQSFCGFVRIAFQVIFHVTGIILIFVYYKWFISACNKLFRWLWDLINGMLGDS